MKQKTRNNRQSVFHKEIQRWKHPVFAVTMLLLAVACFAVYAFIPETSCRQQGGTVRLENPESYCASPDGWNAVVDDRDSIYCLNEEGELVYAVGVEQFPYENAEIIDVAFRDDHRLYCHVAVYDAEAYLTAAEMIFEIDTKGRVIREVVHYNYRDTGYPPRHQTWLSGMHWNGDRLHYIYKDYDGRKNGESGITLMEVCIENPQQTEAIFLPQDGFGKIVKCHALPDGAFLVLKNNGEIATISYDGVYARFYKASYETRTSEGMFPYDVYMAGDTMYMLAGQEELSLFMWSQSVASEAAGEQETAGEQEATGEEGSWTKLFEVKERISMPEETDLYSYGIAGNGDVPVLHVNDAIYVFNEENYMEPHCTGLRLPGDVQWKIGLKQCLPVLAFLFLLAGLVSGIGNLMGWRLTILSKQLLSTIPIVFVMLAAVTGSMLIGVIQMNTEDVVRETIAINEIAAAQFDGDELKNITGYESVDDGQIDRLGSRLSDFMNGNRSGWSRNYSIAIYVRTIGEKFVYAAGSEGSNRFMMSDFSTQVPLDRDFYEDSHTVAADINYGEDRENLHLILLTPIYNADGSYDAVMVLTALQDRLIGQIVTTGATILLNVAIWVAVLILVITLVSAYNVKSLKQAKHVVAQIAKGEFSARIDKYSNDEAGEICAGINQMADKLETSFREKSRNEQFYYKFVPEKFRELLHKEKFTDLELGDAQSADLSILFCDIRAFSLNSEMMTVRESFEFVNRIYGKAGPIIRKHHGFIDKYIGDAIMALFESAEDAVAAGIELYRAIVLNPDAEKDFGLPAVEVGIGIHSGMAQIGIVGEQERMSGTVISNTVNLSSRMEALTKTYAAGMIISKDTLDRMQNPDALSTRYLGMVQVAGVNEVSALYEVLDCLEETKRCRREETKTEFREAVRLFHSGKVAHALELFEQISERDADDKAPRLYAEYVRENIAQGDTKHNVFRFENKQ